MRKVVEVGLAVGIVGVVAVSLVLAVVPGGVLAGTRASSDANTVPAPTTDCRISANETGPYVWVIYQLSDGSIAAIEPFGLGPAQPGVGTHQGYVNITGNLTVIDEMWCDATLYHTLSYWHVDLSTGQLIRET